MAENLIPKVSVIMAVYNAVPFIKLAVNSILTQSFTDFELIIIDDCSTDHSDEIVKSFSDQRIRYFNNSTNEGVAVTRNKGIALSRGEYIAIMDADDISCSDRFLEQVEFLENNDKVGVCGSDFEVFEGNQSKGIVRCVSDNLLIKCSLLFNSPMAHPSIMLRRSLIEESSFFYDPDYFISEDYELWWRLSFKTQFSNINKVLLRYRFHDKQMSERNKRQQKNQSDKLREIILRYYKIQFSEEQLLIHNQFCNNEHFETYSLFIKTEKWLNYLLSENKKKRFLPDKVLMEVIHLKWMSHVYNSSIGISGAVHFLISPLTWMNSVNLNNILTIAAKCLMKRK